MHASPRHGSCSDGITHGCYQMGPSGLRAVAGFVLLFCSDATAVLAHASEESPPIPGCRASQSSAGGWGVGGGRPPNHLLF